MIAKTNGRATTRQMWRALLWGGLALLLALPALAMQFTREVDWTASDFLVMGALLTVLGLGIEAVMRWLTNWPARLAAVVVVVLMFLAIWAELAVGIFGTPFAGS